MVRKERSFLSEMPDELLVYRGMSVQEAESRNYGVSWTLSEEKAEFFAFEYKALDPISSSLEKTVVSKSIKKSDIIAYVQERDEEEVIVIL